MKVTAIGVVRMEGRKEGRDYDFTNLSYLVDVEIVSRSNFNKTGYGYEVAQAEVAPGVMEKFKDLKWPCHLEIQTDSVSRFGKLQTVVTGFSAIAPKVS